MESRQRHNTLLVFIILSIHHVVFCETAQCGGCTYASRPFANFDSNNRNCNPCVATQNCDSGKFTSTMNVPINERSCCNNFINDCQCSSARGLSCTESCTPSLQATAQGPSQYPCSFPISPPCIAPTKPVTKLFLLPNQPCPCPTPPSVSCSPTFSPISSPPVSCCPSFPSFSPQSSLPSVILPPSVPLPQPLCLQTSFPLPNFGIVQPDPTIALCNDVDFENLISECWNDIPRVCDLPSSPPLPSCRRSCVRNDCQAEVPVLLQINSQETNCGSTSPSPPQIIIQKSGSKLRQLLPIILIAMMSGNNNYGNSYSYGGGGSVIPFPYPIPIPYGNYAAEY